jgi:heme/copper-type cytochrome/quinol oxidase subunit 1
MFATVANAMLWLWTTVGVAAELVFQVIPASLGLVQTIDAGLARTLFSWTLHAIVYFWLIPRLHRVLHDGAARGRRTALQRLRRAASRLSCS